MRDVRRFSITIPAGKIIDQCPERGASAFVSALIEREEKRVLEAKKVVSAAGIPDATLDRAVTAFGENRDFDLLSSFLTNRQIQPTFQLMMAIFDLASANKIGAPEF